MTVRRRAEEKFRRSEEGFRRAFEHAPLGILLLDGQGRIERANRAVCAMLGYSEEELLGRVVTELIHPEDRPASERMRARVVGGEVDDVRVERRALSRDGRVLSLEVRSSVQRHADGSVEIIITQVVDVTAQREREAALRDSQTRLQTIFDEAPIGMALIAPGGELLQVNRALARMLGRSVAALARLTAPDIVHPDDLPGTRARVEAALAGGEGTIQGESRYVRPDGSLVWGTYQSCLVHDSDGRPRYFVSQVVDVTERKLAENALRDSEARYRGLVELSQDLIVRMDLAGNLTFVNDAWCAKFGRGRAEALGQSVLPRILPSDQARTAEALRALARPPHRLRTEIRQETVEGLRWMEWEGCGIFAEDGTVIELQGIGRDVTQAHEAEEGLRVSEARYRSLVESQGAVVLRLDLDHRITFVNDYGWRLIGLPREAMLGRDVLEWVDAEDREAVRATLARELEPPHRACMECRIPIGGEVRWFQWEGMLIFDERGAPIELQSVGFDVTERRAAADALRSSLEELRQSQEKLRLLAQRQAAVREEERKRVGFDLHDGVCQELIGVAIMVESVRSRHAAALGAAASDLRRVAAYLNEVVEHLRILAGELRPMLLHDLGLEGSLRSLALGLGGDGTKVEAVFRTAVPRLDEATEVAIYRIAQEALANALRHAHARTVELEVAAVADRLRLTVRDDGRGFEPDHCRSAALGLLSMEERALALGGRLEVRSTPGRGTVVSLECPLGAPAAADRG
ncbi:MAG: PAS domain S-box protein [Deltaproteobacteria bacterium]|nr:PAS domain S-box protein [Deltaproteobacteria bacterium]